MPLSDDSVIVFLSHFNQFRILSLTDIWSLWRNSEESLFDVEGFSDFEILIMLHFFLQVNGETIPIDRDLSLQENEDGSTRFSMVSSLNYQLLVFCWSKNHVLLELTGFFLNLVVFNTQHQEFLNRSLMLNVPFFRMHFQSSNGLFSNRSWRLIKKRCESELLS